MSQTSAMSQPPGRRRRMAPLIVAIALAGLFWLAIAAAFGAWLA